MQAGKQYEGWFCSRCDWEILRGDEIEVDEDGDYDGEQWYNCSSVWHVVCPPEAQ